MLSFLFALALAQATPNLDGTPGASQPAVADAPAATAGEGASPTPKGAPANDYDFVAWCHGALESHMALYQVVKPELLSIERPDEVASDEKNDKLQMAAGRDYLALYTRALNGVERAHPNKGLAERRKAAEAAGAAIWDPYKTAAPRQRMWAWVGWDLPGRCETAARKLETRKGMAAALAAPTPAADEAPAAPR